MEELWMDITTRSKMNQKAAYSVLFCALLASTFVHELKAKGVAPVSSRHHHKGLLSRAASSQTCELSCTWTQNTSTLGISLEVIDNLLVVANYSANAALVLDVSAQIVLVLNGTSGAGVAINIAKQIGVSFASGLWVGGSAELSAFITAKLSTGLTALWSLSGAVTFTVAAIATAALTIIAQVLVKLIVNVAADLLATPKNALNLLLTISSSLIALIAGKLSGILALIVVAKIALVTDLAGLVLSLTSLAEVVTALAVGTLEALIALDISLKLGAILAAKNAFVALANIILAIAANASLAAKLGAYLSSPVVVLSVLAGIGGGVSGGVNGILAIAASTAVLASNGSSIELVIAKVIQVTIGNSVGASLASEFNASASALLSAIAQVSANSSLSVLLEVTSSLKSNSLTINGVNISAIITALLEVYVGATVALFTTIVTVIQLLVAIKAEYLLGVYLLLTLLAKLATKAGLLELIAIGIAVSVSFNLLSILSGSLSLIWGILTGQIWSALLNISGIGTVLKTLGAAWHGGLTAFANLVTQGSALVVAWFQVTSGVSLGASSSALASVASITQYSTNVTHYTALSYTTVFTISASASGSVSVSG